MDRRAEIWTNNNTGRGMDKAGAGGREGSVDQGVRHTGGHGKEKLG